MNKTQKGFAVFETLLLVIIVAIISGVGWYAIHTKHQTDRILSQADKISQSIITKSQTVSTFDECEKVNGSKIEATFPEICVTKDGHSFTQNISPSQVIAP